MRSVAVSKISKSIFKLISLPCMRKYPVHFLLAVSGGADSVALLFVMEELRKKLNFDISVVTVNHNIRRAEESKADVLFVKSLCEKFSPPVKCLAAEIPVQKISELAVKRRKGLEEAARILRYEEFEKACKFFNCSFILTAHTKNDFYETVLMRLFMGAGTSSVLGIAEKRGKYFRPMLEVSREEVEAYLNLKKISWKEDSTNASQTYLRNKIRLSLIPVLNSVFKGWQSGLDKTLSKIALDEKFVSGTFNYLKKNYSWKERGTGDDKEIYCKFTDFEKIPPCFKLRFLQDGFVVLGLKKRISFSSIEKLMKADKQKEKICAGGILLRIHGENLVLKTERNSAEACEEGLKPKKCGYMAWINSECGFSCPAGNFRVEKKTEGFFLLHEDDKTGIGPFALPFCVRSRLNGDSIQITKNYKKTLKRLLNEWTSDLFKREIVPIIEKNGSVTAVYGKAVGLKNLYTYRFEGENDILQK